jgi:hypothetical protein
MSTAGATATSSSRVAVPGDALLHPIAVAALGLLLVNDHVLKSTFPSWWTGKLSDVAALVVLALVVQTVAEMLGAGIGRRTLAAALVVSGSILGAIKLVPAAGNFYEWGMGAAQWVPSAVAALIGGSTMPTLVPVALTRDATDIAAIPILCAVWLVFRDRGA